MKTLIFRIFLSAALLQCAVSALFAASALTAKLDDPQAVSLEAPAFELHGDGKTDDSAAIQAAIDKAAAGEGILLIPSGRYRITRTIYIWSGVRVFGYGATRPVFVLADNTPGYQEEIGLMVMFSGGRPRPAGGPVRRAPAPPTRAGAAPARAGAAPRGGFGGFRAVPFPVPGTVPPNDTVADSSPGTFYSAMSNIDFEIGDGNPAAVAIRAHFAQHCYLAHIDFHIGSGLAGLTEVGNEAEDLRFYGGDYGILTDKPTAAWQFTLIDSIFEGQRKAAIREHEAGLTLIRDTFRNTPIAVEIDPEYYDQLWIKDSRFENISQAAIIISDEKTALNEIGVENAVAQNVPTFAMFRASGKKIAGKGAQYRVANFNFGMILPGLGVPGEIGTIYEAAALNSMPAPMPPALKPLPPTSEWTNIKTLGVTGDGATDDTAAIQKAIDSHRVLYFPAGKYIVTHTLNLKPDSVLIGLHPLASNLSVPDRAPGFQGVGSPVPVVEAPSGGTNILSGIGIYTGNNNPRAAGLIWRASENSMVNDVRFLGGHGSGSLTNSNTQHWDGQYPSIWIKDGGGGSFVNIWTPNTYAQAGFYVSNTTTPGHVYELSNEHHASVEIHLDHVENWDINAPQTEGEGEESVAAVSLEISNCKNVTIANYHGYRVTRTKAPFPAAVRVYKSENIRFRNVHVNGESGVATCNQDGCFTFLRLTKYPFENAIQDMTHHLDVREREFAVLDFPANPKPPAPPNASAVLASGAQVRKLEDGFLSISGAAVDPSGKLFFVDHLKNRIFSWSEADGLLIENDHPLDPVNLAFDKSGNLLVLSTGGQEGSAFSFRPGEPSKITVLDLQDAKPMPNARFLLPVNYWNNGEFRNWLDFKTMQYKTLREMFADDVMTPKKKQYVSADGSIVLPRGVIVNQGALHFSDIHDTYGFLNAAAGDHVYVSSESEDITYSAVVRPDGTLGDLKPFAYRGGEGVAVDSHGNVYVANGQIFVYNPKGEQIARIDVPERPINLIFGGQNKKALFILAHGALYSVAVK